MIDFLFWWTGAGLWMMVAGVFVWTIGGLIAEKLAKPYKRPVKVIHYTATAIIVLLGLVFLVNIL